jgi:hypothetical protein
MSLFYSGPIDLREELNLLKTKHGFRWIALRSARLNKKCTECTKVIDPTYNEPNPNCRSCLGTGHAFIDKLTRAYSYVVAQGFNPRTKIGTVNTKTSVYLLDYNILPKEADFILELDLIESTGVPRQPFSIRKIFKINDARPMRSNRGRIEFFRCFTEEYSFDLGKSIVAPPHTRENVAPTVLPTLDVEEVSQLWEFPIATIVDVDVGLLLDSTTNKFTYTTITGNETVLGLQPQSEPPTGKLVITDINGNDMPSDLTVRS